MKTKKISFYKFLIFCLLFSIEYKAQEKEEKYHFPILGHATSLTAGNIFSKYNYFNFEIGRTYGIPHYMQDPVDILHSFTIGLGTEINSTRGNSNLYKAFVEYDWALFTYVTRSFKLKMDFMEDEQKKNYFFRPSIGLSKHLFMAKSTRDLKVEMLYGYLFQFKQNNHETKMPKHCIMLRLKYNINYVNRFLRLYGD